MPPSRSTSRAGYHRSHGTSLLMAIMVSLVDFSARSCLFNSGGLDQFQVAGRMSTPSRSEVAYEKRIHEQLKPRFWVRAWCGCEYTCQRYLRLVRVDSPNRRDEISNGVGAVEMCIDQSRYLYV